MKVTIDIPDTIRGLNICVVYGKGFGYDMQSRTFGYSDLQKTLFIPATRENLEEGEEQETDDYWDDV